jgi:hypothetical protein
MDLMKIGLRTLSEGGMAGFKGWMRLPEAGWWLPENPGGLHPADDGSGRKMTPPKSRMGFHEAGWRSGSTGKRDSSAQNPSGKEERPPGPHKTGHPGKSAVREQRKTVRECSAAVRRVKNRGGSGKRPRGSRSKGPPEEQEPTSPARD